MRGRDLACNTKDKHRELFKMTKETKQIGIIGLLGIFLVFLLQGSNIILAPAIMNIASALDMDEGIVGQVGTLPAIFSVIAGLLAGRFAGRVIKYKTFLVLSLLISIVGGSCAALFSTWPVILFSRACVGFGVGVFFALPPVLIMKYYKGDEQRNKLGLANVFACLGGLLMMQTVGILVDIQWNSIFLIYGAGIFALVLICIGLKEPESSVASEAPSPKTKAKVPTPVVLNFVLIFVASLFGMSAMIFISGIVQNRGLGTGLLAGTVAIMFNISGAILSFFFGPLHKAFKKYLAIIILVVITIGLTLIYFANSLVMAGAGMFCVGAFLLIVPTLLTDNALHLKPEGVTFASSFLGVAMNLGIFVIGPYIQVATAIGNDGLAPLFFAILGLAVVAVIFFVIRLLQKEPAVS